MTEDILADIRRRDRLVRLKHRREDYRRLRNDIVKKIRRAQKGYLIKQIEGRIGSIKKHWNRADRFQSRADTLAYFCTD